MRVWKALARFSSELFRLGIYRLHQRCTCSLWGLTFQEGLASIPQSPAASSRVSPYPVRIPTHPLYPGKGLPWQKLMFRFRLKCSSSYCVCCRPAQLWSGDTYERRPRAWSQAGRGWGNTQEESQANRAEEEGLVLLDGVQDNSNKAVSLLPCKWICFSLVHTVFN